uniref:Major facilitator superfamily (MFS) profile domain-containing protein n=1 Tax=Caenorhabditis japonica TaxID=281687 RepID=A0A8R1I1Q8_CAEJA
MLNRHELQMLIIFQVAMVFMVQNVFQIYSTFGQQLPATDKYVQDAKSHPKDGFYRFGKREEAQQIVADVFEKSNGKCVIALPNGIRAKPLTMKQIWNKDKYRKVIILFSAIWVMTNFTATMLDFSEVIIFKNSLMYSQMLLAGIPAILGLVEIYLGIVSRRNLHLVSVFVNGITMCASGLFIIFGLQKAYPTLYVVVFVIGYASIEFIWDACYLCVVEQVPTEVRGTISGACSFLSRLSGIAAAKMTIVKRQWESAPLFIAFAAAIIHFLIAFFFLNESKDANLGEIGFTMRRISRKVTQKINQIRNMTKKEKRPSEATIPGVVTLEGSDRSNPVFTPIEIKE